MGFINQWEAPVIVSLLDLGRSPGVHHEQGMVPLKSLVLGGFCGYIMVYPQTWGMLTNEKWGPRKLAQKYMVGSWFRRINYTIWWKTLCYAGYQNLLTGNSAFNQSAEENAVGFRVLFLQVFKDSPRHFWKSVGSPVENQFVANCCRFIVKSSIWEHIKKS